MRYLNHSDVLHNLLEQSDQQIVVINFYTSNSFLFLLLSYPHPTSSLVALYPSSISSNAQILPSTYTSPINIFLTVSLYFFINTIYSPFFLQLLSSSISICLFLLPFLIRARVVQGIVTGLRVRRVGSTMGNGNILGRKKIESYGMNKRKEREQTSDRRRIVNTCIVLEKGEKKTGVCSCVEKDGIEGFSIR